MRVFFANLIMVGLAIALLVHFGLVVRYERVIIQEPNPFILYLEIAGLVAIVVFGIVNMLRLRRRH